MSLYFTMTRWALVAVLVVSVVLFAPELCGVLQEAGPAGGVSVGRRALPPGKGFDDISACGRLESCAGRCGRPPNASEPHRCFCDDHCAFYKDCCMDYDRRCQDPTPSEPSIAAGSSGWPDRPWDPLEFIDYPEQVPRRRFECVQVEEFSGGAVWMKSTCDPRWDDPLMVELCESVHSGETLTRLPVQGQDGLTYRNVYCAQCNYAVVNVIYWISMSVCYVPPPPDAVTNMASLANYLRNGCRSLVDEPKMSGLGEPRFCLQTVDWCDPQVLPRQGGEYFTFMRQCQEEHQGLVRGEDVTGTDRIYRNPFCAFCNGVSRDQMSCDVPALSRFSADFSYYDFFTGVDSVDTRRLSEDEERPLFVVVTNFNLRNNTNVFILATDGSNWLQPVDVTCAGSTVYDPYLGECRESHCAEGYIMRQNQCVHDTEASLVNSSIEMTLSITVWIRWLVEEETGEPLCLSPPLQDNGTAGFNFSDPRANVTERNLVIKEGNVTVDLSEIIDFEGVLDPTSPNATLDDAARFWLSLLTVEVTAIKLRVSDNVFLIEPGNIETFIRSLQGNMGELAQFLETCPEGVKTVYNTEQIVISQDQGDGPDCLSVEVRPTNASYQCGNWLFLDSEPHDNHTRGEGARYGTAVVCEGDTAGLDPTCVRILYGVDECSQGNGTASCSNGKTYGPGQFDRSADGGFLACSDLGIVIETKYVVHFNFTRAQNVIAVCGVALSTTCLSLTLLTYALFRELRTLPGMNMMTLMAVLLVNDWTFMFGLYATDNQAVCRAVGIFLHLICLCQFFWVNVIAYDVFKTFGRRRLTKVGPNASPRRQYLRYSAYAWGMPILIVSVSAALDFCECTPLLVDYGVYSSCWISDPLAYLIFFGVPMILTNASNVCLFARTVVSLRRQRLKSSAISGGGGSPSQLRLCAKLATVMGFAWNLAFLASVLHNAVLWYFFFIFYFLQGVFVFLSYIFNRRVYRLYLRRLGRAERLPSANGTTTSTPGGGSRPPSVTSQTPDTTSSSQPPPDDPAGDTPVEESPPEPRPTYLPSGYNTTTSRLARKCARRLESANCGCSVSHVSRHGGSRAKPGQAVPRRLAAARGVIRKLRAGGLDITEGVFVDGDTAAENPFDSSLRIGQFDSGGIVNEARSSSEDSSSDEDDVFQPAYYFTQC